MVRNYTRLQELIAIRRKQTLAEWNKLIKSTLDEIDQEIREGTGLPRNKNALFTFEGYQEWVRKLGETKGWNIEGGWQNMETDPSNEESNQKGWQKIHQDQDKSRQPKQKVTSSE